MSEVGCGKRVINESLVTAIASDDVLEQAYAWLCHARKDAHHNNSVWDVRFNWPSLKPKIQQQLLSGDYRFSPCRACQIEGISMGVWHAQDALVLKALSLVLTKHLTSKLSKHCYHLPGHGGTKACVMKIKKQVNDYRFVCRSDVNSYYATINHRILMKQLSELIPDAKVLALIESMLTGLNDVHGNLFTMTLGINKGNPLSPLLGAIYLHTMDQVIGEYCSERGLKYYRYMDDWLILCKTRHQLRQVVRLMNQELDRVEQTKHPFKTYIGKIKESGFDFLGYRIKPNLENKLDLAWKTWANHFDKLKQLYEQGASKERIAKYVKHWLVWVRSGVEIDLIAVIKRGLASTLGQALTRKYRVDGFYFS